VLVRSERKTITINKTILHKIKKIQNIKGRKENRIISFSEIIEELLIFGLKHQNSKGRK